MKIIYLCMNSVTDGIYTKRLTGMIMFWEAFLWLLLTGQEGLLSTVFTVSPGPIQYLAHCRLDFKMSVELNGPGLLYISLRYKKRYNL